MLRFTCNHCGARIAISDRNAAHLTVCPECGGVTHPLAAHISPAPSTKLNEVKERIPQPVATAVATTPPAATICANCGRSLGKLEKSEGWNESQVCVECHQTLREQSTGKSHVAPDGAPAAARTSPSGVKPRLNRVASFVRSAVGSVQNGPADQDSRILPRASLGARSSRVARNLAIWIIVMAAGLYFIVSLLRSFSVVIMLGAVAALGIFAFYRARRGISKMRSRLWGPPAIKE